MRAGSALMSMSDHRGHKFGNVGLISTGPAEQELRTSRQPAFEPLVQILAWLCRVLPAKIGPISVLIALVLHVCMDAMPSSKHLRG